MITVCIPIYKRYDLFYTVITALESGTVVPDWYFIYDNGRSFERFIDYSKIPYKKIKLGIPERNQGVAKAWNFFITSTPEERIIINDDIEVHSNTIETLVNTKGDVTACSELSKINSFSCFLIRDNCVNKVGLFDEKLSPDYGYFEDNDYAYRMKLSGINLVLAECSANHLTGGSSTIKKYTKQEMQIHHERFREAEKNYIKKWGGLPTEEKFVVPFGKEE